MVMDKRPCVVLAPELIAKSFLVEEYRGLLERWRDGAFRLAVTRDLLVRYLLILRKLGIPDGQLRHWSAWFTATEKSLFLPEPGSPEADTRTLLQEAALRSGASSIVVARLPDEAARGGVRWVTVEVFSGK